MYTRTDSRKSLLGPGFRQLHPIPAVDAFTVLPRLPCDQITWESHRGAGGWVVWVKGCRGLGSLGTEAKVSPLSVLPPVSLEFSCVLLS